VGENKMKTRIGIDLDGVIRDFSTGLYKIIKEYYPDYIKPGSENVYSVEEIRKEMTDWDLENSFDAPKEEIQRIYREEHAETILGNGSPFKKNVDYLREQIKKDEHTFIAVTSQHPICCHHTLTWLGKQELGFSSVVFKNGRKKWQVDVDYLIDDSPNNYHAWVSGRQMEDGFILMDRPWNQKIKSKYRVSSIKEAMELIKE
jgi:5'(3')-deoxyribonucleotidase